MKSRPTCLLQRATVTELIVLYGGEFFVFFLALSFDPSGQAAAAGAEPRMAQPASGAERTAGRRQLNFGRYGKAGRVTTIQTRPLFGKVDSRAGG